MNILKILPIILLAIIAGSCTHSSKTNVTPATVPIPPANLSDYISKMVGSRKWSGTDHYVTPLADTVGVLYYADTLITIQSDSANRIIFGSTALSFASLDSTAGIITFTDDQSQWGTRQVAGIVYYFRRDSMIYYYNFSHLSHSTADTLYCP